MSPSFSVMFLYVLSNAREAEAEAEAGDDVGPRNRDQDYLDTWEKESSVDGREPSTNIG